jgi:hypothetical protein
MSARQDISGLLERWRRLTEAEGDAIQKAAWPALKEIQAAKAALQADIDAALGKWAGESGRAGMTNPIGEVFRNEVNRLVSLEIRNRELLAAQLQRARREKEALGQSIRTLRKVRRLYVNGQDSGWNSYS